MAALGGHINLGKQDSIDLVSLGASKNYRDVTLEEAVNQISAWVRSHQESDFQTFVFGYGGQHKWVYDELASKEEYAVLWSEFGGPKWLAWLGLVAGQYGLVRVDSIDALPDLVKKLAHRAMIAVLSISQEGLKDALAYLSQHKSKANPEVTVTVDPRATVFVVDNDNGESTTGTLLVEVHGAQVEP